MKHTPENIINLEPHQIFVFGSNEAGLHGGGAARLAYDTFGAEWGKGEGIQGQTYAIPTLTKDFEKRLLEDIGKSIQTFLHYATENPDKEFLVTKIGTGIAGFSIEEIAPFFKTIPKNVIIPQEYENTV